MPYEYEYETADYGDYGYTNRPVYDYTPGAYYTPMLTGLPWVIANIEMIVLFPTVIVLNLILFIVIVRSEKIQSEPWRWLIAHTSFTISVYVVLMFVANLTYIYHLPSLYTTSLCPFVLILVTIFGDMAQISFVLVAIERFRALQLGKGNEGGMGKKAVILSLSVFWLFIVLMESVEPIVRGRSSFGYYSIAPGLTRCDFMFMFVPTPGKALLALWAQITLLIVIIGMIVYACKKTTTPEMKATNVAPTLAFTVIFFFFVMGPEIIYSVIYHMIPNLALMFFGEINVLRILFMAGWISFPIIWLVTWSRSGDICWKKLSPCCHGDDDEKRSLLEGQ